MKVVSLKITHMSDIIAWSEIFMLQYMCYAIRGGVSVLIEIKYDSNTPEPTSLIL
jgi:hypothetical protein